MKITTNFHPSPERWALPVIVYGSIAALAVCLLTAWIWSDTGRLRSQMQELTLERERLLARVGAHQPAEVPDPERASRVQRRVALMRAAGVAQGVSPAGMLSAIERALPPGSKLQRLDYDGVAGVTILTLDSSQAGDLAGFVRALDQSLPEFPVSITRQQSGRDRDDTVFSAEVRVGPGGAR